MALFCKRVARRCFARGFCQKVEVQAEVLQEPACNHLLEGLEVEITAGGKQLLPRLVAKEIEVISLRKELEVVSLKKEMELVSLKKEVESLKQVEHDLRERVADLKDRVADLKGNCAKEKLETLRVKGLNDARGLFEKMQEVLAANCNTSLKGVALWEEILRSNALLGACIEKYTKVRASDVTRQAHSIYHVYSVLSQHVHAGKALADLQARTGGTILYHTAPMSPEQASIFQCVGDVAGFDIAEDPSTRLC